MGDRGNIVVVDPLNDQQKGHVWLYTHWCGSELPGILHRALARKARWDDGAYLTRLIFSEMVKGQENEETGFGISTYMCDNEHPILVVNVSDQTVTLYNQPRDGVTLDKPTTDAKWSFAEFARLGDDIGWETLISSDSAAA